MHPVIEIKKLRKVYRNEKQVHVALEGFSLNLMQGEIVGVIGHSGAGKSTLMRLLLGLTLPTSGDFLFHGQSLYSTKNHLSLFRDKIGMVFQHFHLLSSRTVEENIAFPMEIKGWNDEKIQSRVEELLILTNLSDKKTLFPSKLSGGEKQRVGIARALACHPEVLFCDEATSALDPKSTKEILLLLKELNQKTGITILLITHEMEVVKSLCKRVVVLEKGEIIEEGLVSDLLIAPKKKTTKDFLQSSSHQVPPSFFAQKKEGVKILRLSFKGDATREPIISNMVRAYQVDASILMGWVDYIDGVCFGWLVIELSGSSEQVKGAYHYLEKVVAHCEEVAP